MAIEINGDPWLVTSYDHVKPGKGPAYTQVKLNLGEGAPYLLLEGLDTGRIDLAVMVDPEPRASLAFEPLASEQVYLIPEMLNAGQ